MYADRITGSMQRAIDEVSHACQIQLNYNQKHHIKPISISKPIRDRLIAQVTEPKIIPFDPTNLTADDKQKMKKTLKKKNVIGRQKFKL